MNFAMGRSNSEEWPIVRAVIGYVRRHAIAFRELPVNLRMKVRKRRAQVRVELRHAYQEIKQSEEKLRQDERELQQLIDFLPQQPSKLIVLASVGVDRTTPDLGLMFQCMNRNMVIARSR